MKLFTSTEVLSKRDEQSLKELKRLNTVNKTLDTKRKELDSIKIEFEETLNRNKNSFQKEELEHQAKIITLKTEVEGLEKRRKKALIPLSERWNQLADINESLIKKEEELKVKEEAVEEIKDMLEERLTAVADREQEADRLGKIQAVAQSGINTQKEQVKKQAKEMANIIDKSLIDIKNKEDVLLKEKVIQEIKEKELKDKEIKLNEIEKGFANRERAIKDKYETLGLAIEEAKKNFNIKNIKNIEI